MDSNGVFNKFKSKFSKKCRFFSKINTAFLYPEDKVSIRVAEENGEEFTICELDIKNDFNWYSKYDETISPIKVLTLGRTGSTLLMNLLSEHPEIIINDFYNESNISSYYLNYVDVLYPTIRASNWTEGKANLINIEAVEKKQIIEFPFIDDGHWYFDKYPENLESFVKKNINDYYSALAEQHVKYFVEKGVVHDNSITLLDKMYGNLKFVFLVRDFRDMYASIVLFNLKRGFRAFGRQSFDRNEDYIVSIGRYVDKVFLKAFQHVKDRSILVRYEDIIMNPEKTLKGLYAYLEIDDDCSLVKSILENNHRSSGKLRKQHMTSSTGKKTINKYQKDLDSKTIELLETHFKSSLDYFGY